MREFLLSPNKIQELRAAHKTAAKSKDAYKINAVILLGLGWSLQEV